MKINTILRKEMFRINKYKSDLVEEPLNVDCKNEKRLWLNNLSLNDSAIVQLAQLDLPKLQILSIDQNHITDFGIQKLMKNELSNLIQLSVSDNPLKCQSMVSIMKRSLDELNMQSCLLNGRNFNILLTNKITIPRKLFLSYNNIGNYGTKILSKMDMSNLEILSIQFCKIGAQGFKHLSKANWVSLKKLFIAEKEKCPNEFMNYPHICKYLQDLSIYQQPIYILNLAASKFSSNFLPHIDLMDSFKNLIYPCLIPKYSQIMIYQETFRV